MAACWAVTVVRSWRASATAVTSLSYASSKADVVLAMPAAAAAGIASTTSALEEAYDSEVTAVADALHDLTTVTAQQAAIDTQGRAEHVASTACEAAAALRLPRLDGDKAWPDPQGAHFGDGFNMRIGM